MKDTWNAMADYEKFLVEVQAPMFSRYNEFKLHLEDGMVYGYK